MLAIGTTISLTSLYLRISRRVLTQVVKRGK
uniref:Uncharacterized protein n=1 Tax=Anguilla anguilla TaxID=7936 RepID=A0A0E9UR14_ANGAN